MLYYNISKMFTKNVLLALVVIILNLVIVSALNTMSNDSAIRQTTLIQPVVQTMNQKLTKLENLTLELQTHLHTAPQNNSEGNETNSVQACKGRVCEADIRDIPLLDVKVPSWVHARNDVWKYKEIPDKDDLDLYMINVTGCGYMAREYGAWQSVSNSTARGGTWRRRLAVRGEKSVIIRVTWGTGLTYDFYIGYPSNMETQVYEIHGTRFLTRATPSVILKERYSQFLYIQLEDGVISFGALVDSCGDSTPWLRHSVSMSTGDIVVRMEYGSYSDYGVKLLVCE